MNSQYENSFCEVSGTPFEQGVQMGRELKEGIQRNLARVYEKMEREHVDEKAYREFVNKNIRFFEKNRHDMYEELQGIAEGSGIPFEEILMLNIPAYFLADKFTCITQECSMLCVRAPATADGCTYVIKNRDMGSPAMEQALIKRTYPDGLQILEVSGSGTVTFPAVGMNSYGLAVTTTGFWSEKDPTRVDRVEEADIFLNVRVLLTSCKTAAEAVEFCRTAPRMNGLNVIVADPKEAYVLEMTADDMYVEKDEGRGVLYRTNHMVSDQMKVLNPPEEEYPSTHKRYQRIGEMIEKRYGKLRFQDLYRIMSDHKYEPNCICRHPHDDVLATTVSCTVCTLEDFELWTTIGNPCMNLRHAGLNEE